MSGWWQQQTWRTVASHWISCRWHLSYTLATEDYKLYISLIQTCANIYTHPHCANHRMPSISAQVHGVLMLRNTTCLVCNTKEGSILPCHVTGVTLVTSHKKWKLLNAWYETCLLRFQFPLETFSSDDINGSVIDGAVMGLSLGLSCCLEHQKHQQWFESNNLSIKYLWGAKGGPARYPIRPIHAQCKERGEKDS